MELLIIKNRNDYIRIKNDEYLKCKMDKASVFPLDKKNTIVAHIKKLKKMGEDVAVFKLTITEEPYNV